MILGRSHEPPAARHRVASGSFPVLVPRLARAGLALGAQGVPVAVFRPARPVRAVAVGPFWLAEHLVLRALAAGAVVTTRTSRPERWGAFSDAVDQPRERLTFRPPGADDTVTTAASRPHLLLDDSAQAVGPGTDGVPAAPAGAPGWTLQVAYHDPELERHVWPLAGADLLLVHEASVPTVQGLPGHDRFAELPERPAATSEGAPVALSTAERSCWIVVPAGIEPD